MKNIVLSMFIVTALFWISGVSAGESWSKQSPESILTCASLGTTYVVTNTAISGSINTETCAYESPCNPCIESLESQGCIVLDVAFDHLVRDAGEVVDWTQAFSSFLLSCKKP